MRYRLLSEPELSNLFRTTLSNGSLQSTKSHQKSNDEPENASSSDLDLPPDNLINEQKSPRLLATDDDDDNSQNRNNNNLLLTWEVFNVLSPGWRVSRVSFYKIDR